MPLKVVDVEGNNQAFLVLGLGLSGPHAVNAALGVFPAIVLLEHVGSVPGVILKSLSTDTWIFAVNPPFAVSLGLAYVVFTRNSKPPFLKVLAGTPVLGRNWKFTQDVFEGVGCPVFGEHFPPVPWGMIPLAVTANTPTPMAAARNARTAER